MKKLFIFLTIVAFTSLFATSVFAQEMMENNMMGGNDAVVQSDDGHTASGEAEGKEIWEKLQAQELNCEDVSDEDFHALGMYFMGLMVGDSHEVMDTMMEQMMGEEGEDQMHIAMGKRMSGCEPDAPMPQSMMNGSMMQMMMGGDGNSMMGNWGQNSMWWGGFGSWLISLLWFVWLIVGILAAVWLWRQIIKK